MILDHALAVDQVFSLFLDSYHWLVYCSVFLENVKILRILKILGTKRKFLLAFNYYEHDSIFLFVCIWINN